MSRHGRRPHLVVTGAWTTLAGLDDLPGELDGHGTITAQLLRQIAASWGSVTAVGVNPATGTATAVGGTAYRPRQKVSDQVILLSGTCRVAGCRMPAWKCELDHVDPYNHTNPDSGGQSTLSGLLPACKWHHLLKHHTNWTPAPPRRPVRRLDHQHRPPRHLASPALHAARRMGSACRSAGNGLCSNNIGSRGQVCLQFGHRPGVAGPRGRDGDRLIVRTARP